MSEHDAMARIAWRSRRGLLELDVWLGHFVRHALPGLSPAECGLYEQLLDYPDPELMDILEGRVRPPTEMATLILRIQQTDTIHHD
jgi:antitoxin CptB